MNILTALKQFIDRANEVLSRRAERNSIGAYFLSKLFLVIPVIRHVNVNGENLKIIAFLDYARLCTDHPHYTTKLFKLIENA